MAPTQIKGTQVSDGSLGTVDIFDGAITLAKLSSLAANSVMGNNTASPATPIAMTAAQVRTLINVADGATANVGTVTGVSVTTANGVSGTVTGAPTPAITLTLGSITPTNVSVTASTGTSGYHIRATGDTQDRVAIDNSGTIYWGPGNAAVDVTLFRNAANVLKTGDDFVANSVSAGTASGAVSGDVLASNHFGFDTTYYFRMESGFGAIQNSKLIRYQSSTATDPGFGTMITGDSYSRFKIVADGSIWWGNGAGGQDCYVARDASSASLSVYLTSASLPVYGFAIRATYTITGNVGDGYAGAFGGVPTYNGAFTVTRHNYINLINVAGTSTTTAAAVIRFDAAVGTHKALAANSTVATTLGSTGPTGATAGAPQGWMRINVNGTLRFIPFW